MIHIVDWKFDKQTLRRYSTQTIVAGVLMALLGAVGIFVPSLMSLVVVNFLAWLFLFSAIVQGYNTYKNYRKSVSAWLKVALSLISSMLLLFFPVEGVAAVGILLAAYLLLDAFGSIGFAWEYRPNKGWWMMLINGILSILLAIILLAGWPFSSLILVGLFVGFSLFFDGIALIALGVGAKKITDDEIDQANKKER